MKKRILLCCALTLAGCQSESSFVNGVQFAQTNFVRLWATNQTLRIENEKLRKDAQRIGRRLFLVPPSQSTPPAHAIPTRNYNPAGDPARTPPEDPLPNE